jgi:hypothetical protein
MAALREILIEFGVQFDTQPIEEGEKKVGNLTGSLKDLGAALAAAFAIDKIKDFVLGAVEAGDALGDQAARLNISTQALEEWTYQAKFADIAAGELDGIFNKLARTSVEAADATSEQGKVLKKLGVDVKDKTGAFKDTGTLFEEVGLALAGMSDQTEKTALSFQFFGKTAGPKVLQLFKDGPEGIARMREEFEELGGGMGDFVEQAGEVDDNMHRLDLAWTSAKVKIAGLFLPAVNGAIFVLTKFSQLISFLSKNTNALQATLAVFAAFAIAKAGALLVAYGPLIGTFLLWAAAIAAVVLILDDLITFFEGGDSAIGRAIESWFGEGSSEKVRAWGKALLEACDTFLSGALEVALGTIHGILDLISIALSDDANAIDDLGSRFLKNTAAMSDAIDGLLGKIKSVAGFTGPTVEESAAADHAGRADTTGESLIRRAATFVLGDPLKDAAVQGDLARIRAGDRVSTPKATDAGGGAPVVVNNAPVTNVTLPPGSPTQVVRAAGNAAEAGAMKGANRAAKAALERKGK